jgi:Leucine-rich repeat (LRR) protein
VSAIGMLLKNSTTLRNLVLTGSRVRDASIVGLEEIPTLEVLILSGTKVTDVRRLRACRSLQRLDADSTYLNTDGIENLGSIVSLVTLRLCHCDRITSLRGLACQPTQIENLDLAGCHSWITDRSAWCVCSFPVLRKLDLSHNRIDDRVLAAVGNLPSLTVLILRCCIIDGVALLQKAAVLLELDLAGSDVHSLRGIECVPCLETLSLRGCTFSEKFGSILPRCPAIRHLDLEGTRATTDDLVGLARMSALETLNLRQCPAIASSIALLSYPALKTVMVSPGAFETSEMAVLQRTVTVVELESVELACRWP